MHFFGDKEILAILYRPYDTPLTGHAFAYCHFILGGHFIGNKEEPCMLSTWTSFVESLRNHIEANKGNLSNSLFKGLTEREIFELIYKSNQLEEEFDPTFDYLTAQSTNELWAKHHISLDETIDAYSIVVIESSNNLKFIWKGWRDPCPQDEIEKLYSITIGHNFFLTTVDSCLDFLKETYPEIRSMTK